MLNRDRLWPGEEASVNINFPDKKYLGDDFVVGKKFTFDEGNTNVGEGIIEGIDEVTEGF